MPLPVTEVPTLALVTQNDAVAHEIPIGASGSSVGFGSARTAGPHAPSAKLNTKPRASTAAHAVGDAQDTPGAGRGSP